MADQVGKLVVDVIKKECTNLTCSFRSGDSGKQQEKLAERIIQKLKHRLADGNEVRKLEDRVEVLEKALRMCLRIGMQESKLTKADLVQISKALAKKKET